MALEVENRSLYYYILSEILLETELRKKNPLSPACAKLSLTLEEFISVKGLVYYGFKLSCITEGFAKYFPGDCMRAAKGLLKGTEPSGD